MKKFLLLVLTIFVVLSLVACVSPSKDESTSGGVASGGASNTSQAEGNYLKPSEVLRFDNIKDALPVDTDSWRILEAVLRAIGKDSFTDMDISYYHGTDGSDSAYVEFYLAVPFTDEMKKKIDEALEQENISHSVGRHSVDTGKVFVRMEDTDTTLIKVMLGAGKPLVWSNLKGAKQWPVVKSLIDSAGVESYPCLGGVSYSEDISLFAAGDYISVNVEFFVDGGGCLDVVRKAISSFAKVVDGKVKDGKLTSGHKDGVDVKLFVADVQDGEPHYHLVLVFKPTR